MRFAGVMIGLMLLAGGCAARPARPMPPMADPWHSASLPAEALVFSPGGVPEGAYLPRHVRESRAFVGYDELSTHYYHVRTIDRQTSDWTDRYERKAIIHRSGVSFR
jgi:hypothetical protein